MHSSIWKLFQTAVAVTIFAVAAQAEKKTVSGYLVDKACSQELAAKGQKALAAHDKDCALMDSCLESGFGVVTADGKFIAFDPEGNKKAIEAMKASGKDRDYQVTVTGEQQGDTIRVASLKLQ